MPCVREVPRTAVCSPLSPGSDEHWLRGRSTETEGVLWTCRLADVFANSIGQTRLLACHTGSVIVTTAVDCLAVNMALIRSSRLSFYNLVSDRHEPKQY